MARSTRTGILALAGTISCVAAIGLAGSGPASAHGTAALPLSRRLASTAAPTAGTIVATRPEPLSRRLSGASWTKPPTTADCEARELIACYAPAQVRRAYHLSPLYKRGLTGRGSTIVIVDAFGSPTAQADLHRFDTDFGLPDPPRFTVLQPAGQVPQFDPNDDDQVGWASETSLDVQWAHATAPGANIVLVETPVTETEGIQGFPQIVKAENYVIDHKLGDVISQSFGATENTFPSKRSLLRLRSAFVNAAKHGVTVLASSGDSGPTGYRTDGAELYTHRVNSWPSSDPLVTSVGGTQLRLDAHGNRTAPDRVWNESDVFETAVASGGGTSSVFARPAYQNRVRSVVGRRRGTPDISMSAAVDGGLLVYLGFTDTADHPAGYSIFGGTSAASPELAGVLAIAKQRAHHRLGPINAKLYKLAAGKAKGIPDITRGNTTVAFTQGRSYTVKGYRAAKGYDLASGLGSVRADLLTAELARR